MPLPWPRCGHRVDGVAIERYCLPVEEPDTRTPVVELASGYKATRQDSEKGGYRTRPRFGAWSTAAAALALSGCFAGGRYIYSRPEADGATHVSSQEQVRSRWLVPISLPSPSAEIRLTAPGGVPLRVNALSEYGEHPYMTIGPLLPIIPNPFAWGEPWCDSGCGRSIHIVVSIGPVSGVTLDPREIQIERHGVRQPPLWWDCRFTPETNPPVTPPIAFDGRADVSVFHARGGQLPAEFVLYVGGLRKDGTLVPVPPIRFRRAGTILLYAWAP